MKFRKKPVVIEAFRFDGEPLPEPGIEGFKLELEDNVFVLRIKTLEGIMTARPGDWIITGVKGERYPCKPDIFDATYEAVE